MADGLTKKRKGDVPRAYEPPAGLLSPLLASVFRA